MHLRSVVTAAAILAAGCGATVKSSVAPGANLGQYRTFGFATPPAQAGQPISVADQDINNSLRQALISKGFAEATNGQPDFLVSHSIKLQQELQVNSAGYGWPGYWGGVDAYTYTEGTLIVDFVDPKTNKAFWRGTASSVVNNPSSPDAGRIQSAVSKMIRKYPSNLAVAPRTTM